jgi:hypothetical protein
MGLLMDGALYEAELARTYPDVPWRKSLLISVPGVGSALGCRICIARFGLKGKDVTKLPKTELEFKRHLAEEHPDPEARADA